jgi:hypothetical protein
MTMNRRQLFALPLALFGATAAKPKSVLRYELSDVVSADQLEIVLAGMRERYAQHSARAPRVVSAGPAYQFKPGDGERLAAALAGVKPVGPAFITHTPNGT